MGRVKTLERVAAITATLHDGTNMIVLNQGKNVRFAESSLTFLLRKGAIEDTDLDALDHDGDGKAGGSTTPTGDLTALRERYEELAGKRVFNGWDAETLNAKIAELEASTDDDGDASGDADDAPAA